MYSRAYKRCLEKIVAERLVADIKRACASRGKTILVTVGDIEITVDGFHVHFDCAKCLRVQRPSSIRSHQCLYNV